MKTLKVVLFLILTTTISIAQKKQVTLTPYQSNNTLTYYAKNHSSITQEVILSVHTTGFKKHPKEITKLIKPKDSIEMLKLIAAANQNPTVRASYKFYPKPTKQEKNKKDKVLAKKAFKDGDDINKGIIIFDKSNCSRCQFTTSFLLDNNIDFKHVIINLGRHSKNLKEVRLIEKNRALLRQKMEENGIFGTYTTPVIMIDGKLSHSHSQLTEFLQKIKKG